MSNLDLYQQRIRDSKKISKSKLVDLKIKTFKNALERSYNSEVVQTNNSEFKALITGIPTQPKIGKKSFATLRDHGCEVGDEIYWLSNNSHWLITDHDETEGAIFQGSIEKTLYEIKWKDPISDRVYSARACAKGPDETTVGSGVKHAIMFDILTDSLYLIVSAKAEGSHLLKRYTELMVNGKKWRIEVVDNMTRENLIYMQLMETPFNRDSDTDEIAGGKVTTEFTARSSLDKIEFADLNSTIDFVPLLLRNGSVVNTEDIEIRATNCTYEDNTITFDKIGLSSIRVNFKEYEQVFTWSLEVVEQNDEQVIIREILGAKQVKTFDVIDLYAADLLNGKQQSFEGQWIFDEDYFTLVKEDGVQLKLQVKNKTGTTTVEFIGADLHLETEIKIVPMFGGS